MDYVKIRTVAADHPRFLEAGELAAALWAWGMLYAGRHETDGIVPRVAVLAWPWCTSRSRAMKAAYKLVEVGLWTSTETGFTIVGWSEQGNMTKAGIDAERASARDRMKRRRSKVDPTPESGVDVRANIGRTSPDVPTSLSTSLCSGSGSGSGSRDARARPTLDTPLPDTWRARALSGEITTGEVVDVDVVWSNFRAWCVDEATRPFTEARWVRWVSDERTRSKARRMSGPKSATRIVQNMAGEAFEMPAGLR